MRITTNFTPAEHLHLYGSLPADVLGSLIDRDTDASAAAVKVRAAQDSVPDESGLVEVKEALETLADEFDGKAYLQAAILRIRDELAYAIAGITRQGDETRAALEEVLELIEQE